MNEETKRMWVVVSICLCISICTLNMKEQILLAETLTQPSPPAKAPDDDAKHMAGDSGDAPQNTTSTPTEEQRYVARQPSDDERRLQGLYLGLPIIGEWGRVRLTVTKAGSVTESPARVFDEEGTAIFGGGVTMGYNFAPWNKNVNKGWGRIRVGPFAEYDYMNMTITHFFDDGTFIGTHKGWSVTTGLKVGGVAIPGLLIYGISGASWLNEEMVNFGVATATSRFTTIPGFTLGPGVEYQLSTLPISVFAQYQHTWWGDAHLNNPAASPGFNDTFRREDDTIKVGVNVYFHKARILKNK